MTRAWPFAGVVALMCLGPAAGLLYQGAPGSRPRADFGLSPARSETGTHIAALSLGGSDYCASCHTAIYQQWTASAHHFSSFNNPFYRRVVLETGRKRGRDVVAFCAGCHDPVPLLSGELDGLNLKGWSANAGITCLTCHLVESVHGGNGAYVVARPTLDATMISGSPLAQAIHSGLLKAAPGLHRRALSKPLYAEARYCAACHTVSVPKEVNGVASVDVQTDHAEWLQTRFAHHEPGNAPARSCADCHMPLVRAQDPAAPSGWVRSHRFPGGNTALPTLNRDQEQLEATERFLADGAPRLTLRATYGVTPVAVGSAPRGLALHVSLENGSVGHGFPGGAAESSEAWISVLVRDALGRDVLSLGTIDGRSRVTPGADFLRAVFLDRAGQPTGRPNTSSDAVAAARGTRLGAGEVRELVYGVKVTSWAQFPLKAQVRLNWRKFSPDFVEWAFEGKAPPAMPVTVVSEGSLEIPAMLAPYPKARPREARLAETGTSRGDGR